MAIISSYTIGTPTVDDYLIGTDDPGGQGPTKNFTLQSIINLVSGTLGDNNFYLSGISSNSSTGAITFTVTGGSNQTLTLGTAAFKATTHFALATDLTTHINDSTQPHSLDSIVTAQSLVVTKLQGITTNGTSGQLLASNGSGGLSFVTDQDNNDNYFLSAVTRPDASSNNIQFTISGGGSNVTSTIFGEAAFLSKSDIRTDVKNNLTYTAADFAFLGDLATKDTIDSGDIDDGAVINARIQDGTIEESKLKISNTEVSGYVLTSDGAGGFTWVLNSASNYFLDGISKSNETLTFSINGGTDITYTFGKGAFADFGSTANDVAAGNHTHVLADITDSGALAGKDTTATSDIANNAITLAKLSDSSATNGQILSVNSSGNLEFINSSAVAVPAVRLLPSSIGSASQIIRVNSGASATEYVTLAVAKTEFATGNSPSAGKILGLDSNNDLQWVDSGTASIGTDTLTSAKINFFENTLSIAAGKILVASSGGTKFDSVAMSGDIAIASSGATTIQANAVETAMIADDNVTPAKINILDDSLAATSAHILIGDGTDFGNVAVSGDVAIAANGATTIQADSVENDMLEARFTDEVAISTLTGTVAFNCANGSVFKLSGDLTGAYTIQLTGFKKGQVITVYPLKGNQTVNLATASGTPTFNKLGGTDYEDNGTSSNILQIECVDDATNATFFYSLATFASDASDI